MANIPNYNRFYDAGLVGEGYNSTCKLLNVTPSEKLKEAYNAGVAARGKGVLARVRN